MRSANGRSASGRLTRLDRDPGPAVDQAGNPEADRLHFAADCIASLFDRFDHRLDEGGLVSPKPPAALDGGRRAAQDRRLRPGASSRRDRRRSRSGQGTSTTIPPFAMDRRKAKLHPLPLAPEARSGSAPTAPRDGLDDLRGRHPPRPATGRARRRAASWRALHRSGACSATSRPRGGRLGPGLAAAVPGLGPGPAPEGQRRRRLGPQRLGLPAHLAEHDPRARLRRPHEGHEGAGRQRRRPQPLGHDPADARRRRARPRGSRSRATRSRTSPATGPTRSTPPTRIGGPASRSRPSSSSSASRSTTSSRSTSRTSPTSSTRSAASTTPAAA